MKKKTKIIATVGPSTDNEKTLEQIYKAGVNVIRFNFSHAKYEQALETIKIIQKLNNLGKTNLSLLLDTKGPEIRTGEIKEKIVYQKGDIFNIYVDSKIELKNNSLFCDYPYLIEDVKIGSNIIIDSGLFNVKVIKKEKDYIVVKALNSALIGSRRHINLPGIRLKLPGVTQKDKEDIIFAIKNNFSFIAASFIRSKENVLEIKEIFEANDYIGKIKVISKIENKEAIENLDEIIDVSDGIMVARGDLGMEVPIEKLAVYQKEIVDKCKKAGKFVITATHLLETMIENPTPTRAEVSDIFNSVLQKADSLMLSGETATGKFPIESVKMMTSIINEAEKIAKYNHKEYSNKGLSSRDIEKKLLIRSSLFIGEELGAKALIILTKTGLLAKLTSAFRPSFSVYAFTPNEWATKNMNVLFGINPIFLQEWDKHNYSKNLDEAINFLLKKKIIKNTDKVLAINDIQRANTEIPIMEIIDLRYY